MELKTIFEIFSTQEFIGNIKNEKVQQDFAFMINRVSGMKKKYSKKEEDFSLRVYTNQPKEIKFTTFLFQKISERHGNNIIRQLEGCF